MDNKTIPNNRNVSLAFAVLAVPFIYSGLVFKINPHTGIIVIIPGEIQDEPEGDLQENNQDEHEHIPIQGPEPIAQRHEQNNNEPEEDRQENNEEQHERMEVLRDIPFPPLEERQTNRIGDRGGLPGRMAHYGRTVGFYLSQIATMSLTARDIVFNQFFDVWRFFYNRVAPEGGGIRPEPCIGLRWMLISVFFILSSLLYLRSPRDGRLCMNLLQLLATFLEIVMNQ